MFPLSDRQELPLARRLFALFGRSLTLKVLALSAAIVLPLSGTFWYRSLLSEKRYLTENAVDFAAASAELVRKSVHEQLLLNDRDGVQRTVASVSGTEALRSVRIYNRHGVVAYSSRPSEVGWRVVRYEQPCLGCHDDPLRPRETIRDDRRHLISRGSDGQRVLNYIEPIYSEMACSTASCHAHVDKAKVLGILLAEVPLTRLDRRVEAQVRAFSAFVVLYLVALGTAGYFLLWRIVLRPVGALANGVEQVAGGKLTHMVPVISGDEIGRLAGNFNAMTMELSASRRRMERLAEDLERQIAVKTAEVRRTEGLLSEAERLAALGRLTAEIAHEIRNPLMALGGYARRLQRTVTSDEQRESVRIVVDEATRLEGLLRDVLDLSRPERFELRRLPLAPVVRESLSTFGERCAERGVVVETDFGAEPEAFIDRGHLRRAVDNIVANAIDAMPRGGVLRVTTGFAAALSLTYATITVEDTGPGIPAADLSRVFEPFWTTKKGEGTGLGLPITRKILAGHRGHIRISNRPGGGLSTSLWFPFQSAGALERTPCWEAMRCGRAGEDAPDLCPAWPHFGHACWAVAGTHCEGVPTGTMACNLGDCGDCGYFRSMNPG